VSALCRNLSLNVLQTGSTWHCTASRVGSPTGKEADLAYWKFCVFGETRGVDSGGMTIRALSEDKHVVRLRWDIATSVRRRDFGEAALWTCCRLLQFLIVRRHCCMTSSVCCKQQLDLHTTNGACEVQDCQKTSLIGSRRCQWNTVFM